MEEGPVGNYCKREQRRGLGVQSSHTWRESLASKDFNLYFSTFQPPLHSSNSLTATFHSSLRPSFNLLFDKSLHFYGRCDISPGSHHNSSLFNVKGEVDGDVGDEEGVAEGDQGAGGLCTHHPGQLGDAQHVPLLHPVLGDQLGCCCPNEDPPLRFGCSECVWFCCHPHHRGFSIAVNVAQNNVILETWVIMAGVSHMAITWVMDLRKFSTVRMFWLPSWGIFRIVARLILRSRGSGFRRHKPWSKGQVFTDGCHGVAIWADGGIVHVGKEVNIGKCVEGLELQLLSLHRQQLCPRLR